MGAAKIVENLGKGKYKVKIDKNIESVLEKITDTQKRINTLVNKTIPDAEIASEDAFAKYETEANKFGALIDELKTLTETVPVDRAAVDLKREEVRAQTTVHLDAESAAVVAQRNLRALNLKLLSTRKELERWNKIKTEIEADIREVWAVDHTTNLTVNKKVGLTEINGETTKLQIAAGGTLTDGTITHVRSLSTAESFAAKALLPGWQKWQPTYRHGIITDIDYSRNIGDVTLDIAKSTAVSLNKKVEGVVERGTGFDINQSETLESVPFSYMSCNSSAFAKGDHVVIQFTEQKWTRPVIIGFVESPRACHIQVKIRFKKAEAKQAFIDFCTARQSEWETFSSLLADFYSPADGGSGLLVDLMQWHQDNVGNIRSVSYGVQGE